MMGRVGRGSVEGTWRDLANRYYADEKEHTSVSYQGQSSKLGVGSLGEVLYCTVLHQMAPVRQHRLVSRLQSVQKKQSM